MEIQWISIEEIGWISLVEIRHAITFSPTRSGRGRRCDPIFDNFFIDVFWFFTNDTHRSACLPATGWLNRAVDYDVAFVQNLILNSVITFERYGINNSTITFEARTYVAVHSRL